jgi:hypothetical protein
MYSISGNYIAKNKIIEPMVPGMVAIDKDAIAAESDRRGTSTKSGSSYSEKTGGIQQTKDVKKEINIVEKSKSYSEEIEIIDKETTTEVSEETKTERKATLTESVFKSKSTKTIPKNSDDIITMCEHCNLDKCTVKLSLGNFPDLRQQNVDIYGPNGISSLMIPAGFSLSVYSKINYGGKTWTIDGPNQIGCLVHFGWNDTIASCKINKTGSKAKFALHCSFGGWNKEFGPGEYPSVVKLGMTGGISSIKLGSDLKIIAYENENFAGASKEWDGPVNINCLVSYGWNDRINSIKIISKSANSDKRIDLSKEDWTKYYNKSPNKVIKRECQDCEGEYQTIFYKRLTAISKLKRNNQDLRDLFLNNWFSDGNKLNVDFQLYNNYNDIIDETVSQKIKITSVEYGKNCGAGENSGSTLEHIKGKCDGKIECKYKIDHGQIGDPARGCSKNYTAKFRCGDEIRDRDIYAHNEASGKYITLTCGRVDDKWTVCNYDDPTVGFPRDCGKTKLIGGQWNAINRTSAKSKIRFSMEVGRDRWRTLYQTPEFVIPYDDNNIVDSKKPQPGKAARDSRYVYTNPKDLTFNNNWIDVSAEEKFNLLEEYTIMCWVYKNKNTNQWVRVIGKSWWGTTNYGLWIGGGGAIVQEVALQKHGYVGMLYAPTGLKFGEWTHIAGSFKNGVSHKMYVNGKVVKTFDLSKYASPAYRNKEPFQIGGWSGRPNESLVGNVKNIAILNKQLSDDEIKKFAADHTKDSSTVLAPPPPPPGKKSSYEEESYTKVTDLSAVPKPGETLWHYVKDRKKDENKYLWSAKIYNCMKGGQNCGTDFADEGGSRHNAIWYLPDNESLPSNCVVSTLNEYAYKKIGGDISDIDHIFIEVTATNDAHIALGENASHNSTHYELVLGGWGNNKSVIRPSNQGSELTSVSEKIFGQDLVPGLLYKYYNITNSNGAREANPYKSDSRHESINYYWGRGVVGIANKSDHVGINISGLIKFPKSGNYKFRIRTDDGFRMKISDNYIINKWYPQGPTWHESGNVKFEEDQPYKFDVEWYEWGGHAVMQIYWMTPGSNTWEVIPKEAFFQFTNKPQKFWISWKNNKLKIGRDHELNKKQLMETDVSGYKYKIKSVLVSTGWGSTGVWKLYSGPCDPNKLSKETADKMCNNPCYWYGEKGGGQSQKAFIDANMCDCSKDDEPFGCHERSGKCAKAINWDVLPTTLPSFTNSKTHSVTSTKEYQEKIKIEEKNTENIIRSSELTSDTIELDPNISIIPGKSKPNPYLSPYFTDDELKKEEKVAGEKLKLSGGPVVLNNIVSKISKDDIEKPPKEIPKVKSSKPLPPPPPPKPKARRTLPVKQPVVQPAVAGEQGGSGINVTLILFIVLLLFLYFFYMKKD